MCAWFRPLIFVLHLCVVRAVVGASGCLWNNVTTISDVNYFHNVSVCYNRAVSDSMKMKVDDIQFLMQDCPVNKNLLSFDSLLSEISKIRKENRHFVFIGDSVLKQEAVVLGCMIDHHIDFGDCIQRMEAQQKSVCHVETSTMKLHLYKIGRKFNRDDQLNKTLQSLLAFNGSSGAVKLGNKDVVIVNQGLHHTSTLELEELKSLAAAVVKVKQDAMLQLAKDQIPHFVWSETTPQHYLTCNGWYDHAAASSLRKQQCLAYLTQEMTQGLLSVNGLNCTAATARNDLTNPIMEDAGITVNHVYEPLVNTSVNFHLNSPVKRDCTHYRVDALIFMNQMLLSRLKGLERREGGRSV